jgi:hypothetical protein
MLWLESGFEVIPYRSPMEGVLNAAAALASGVPPKPLALFAVGPNRQRLVAVILAGFDHQTFPALLDHSPIDRDACDLMIV